MQQVSRLGDEGYWFEADPGRGSDEPEPEYPTLLLKLIERPSGPEWFQDYLRGLDRKALASDDPADRIRVTKNDPLLFALVYLIHHLRSAETRDKISFADFHVDLLEQARDWVNRPEGPREHRDAYVAPRGSGKSTWLFCLLPIWSAAHNWVKFVAAFSDSADQSKNHLATIRSEFDTNDLLVQDFPLLCAPKVRRTGGALAKKTVSARVDKIEQANGFVMIAKGSGTAARGLKVGKLRPDLIILDDIEPGEEKYSEAVMRYRLRWLLETVFHLNEFARVIIVGTVTAPGSIMHQLVESVLHPSEDTPPWIADQEIKVHYYPPFIQNDDGTRRSCWPAKWPLAYLEKHEHTQDFKKEFLNQPVNLAGDYWTEDDFEYLDAPTVFDVLQIDPAVTAKRSSHETGIAILGWSILEQAVIVKFATTIRKSPKELRNIVLWYVEQWPEIGEVHIESNQGGETWSAILHDLPVKVLLTWSELPKELRFSRLLNLYQRGRIKHMKPLTRLEAEMCGYRGGDSDLIDAVEQGVRRFIRQPKKKMSGGTYSYARRTPDRELVGR